MYIGAMMGEVCNLVLFIAYGYYIHRLNPQVFLSDHCIKAVYSTLYTFQLQVEHLYNKFLEAW